jgi:hypothetical protein
MKKWFALKPSSLIAKCCFLSPHWAGWVGYYHFVFIRLPTENTLCPVSQISGLPWRTIKDVPFTTCSGLPFLPFGPVTMVEVGDLFRGRLIG